MKTAPASIPPILLLFMVITLTATADIPLKINHQGLVKVDGEPFGGALGANGLFKFGLVDWSGNWLWTNDGSHVGLSADGHNPDTGVTLLVTRGIYHVRLGDTSLVNMSVLPSSVFDGENVGLRVIFDDGANGEQVLAPDQPVTSVPYAYHALKADSATDADTVDGFHASDFGLKGYLHGGIISNGSPDDARDLAVSAIVCRDDSNATMIEVDSLTKRGDAVWAAGDNQGGLDSGALGDAGFVYVYAIDDADGASPGDYLLSKSLSPAMPSGYDVKRLIGARRWNGAAFDRFYTTGVGNDKWVFLKAQENILNNGNQTEWTAVDASAYVPVATSRFVDLSIECTNDTYIRCSDTSAGGTKLTGKLTAQIALDSNGRYEYQYGPVMHRVRAFLESLE